MGWVQGMSERVRPFTEGSEFADWKSRNCERCTLRWEEKDGYRGYQCDIEMALDYSYFDNGTVTEAIGKVLKFDGQRVAEDCQARELVEIE